MILLQDSIKSTTRAKFHIYGITYACNVWFHLNHGITFMSFTIITFKIKYGSEHGISFWDMSSMVIFLFRETSSSSITFLNTLCLSECTKRQLWDLMGKRNIKVLDQYTILVLVFFHLHPPILPKHPLPVISNQSEWMSCLGIHFMSCHFK